MGMGAALAAVPAALVAAAPAGAEVHVTRSANPGAGTLRAAVEEAAAPGETVVIDPGVEPLIEASEISVDKSLTLRGQGAGATTISVNGETRAFDIGPGISVTFEGLKIAGDRAPNGAPGAPEIFPTPPGDGQPGGRGGISGAVTVRASILAGNGGDNCGVGVVSAGGNLAAPDAGGCVGFAVGDPGFDPAGLAPNGGPTQTVALMPGGAALDAVPAAACVTAQGGPLAVDQRGVARPQGAACDAGAYEREVTAPPSPPRQQANTTLTKKPKKLVRTTRKRATVKIRFSSDPPGAGFECKLDRARFKPCGSPKTYRLKPGRHQIAVRAVLGGVVDPSPAKTALKVVRQAKKRT